MLVILARAREELNPIILSPQENTYGLEKRVDVDYGADKIVISDPLVEFQVGGSLLL